MHYNPINPSRLYPIKNLFLILYNRLYQILEFHYYLFYCYQPFLLKSNFNIFSVIFSMFESNLFVSFSFNCYHNLFLFLSSCLSHFCVHFINVLFFVFFLLFHQMIIRNDSHSFLANYPCFVCLFVCFFKILPCFFFIFTLMKLFTSFLSD